MNELKITDGTTTVNLLNLDEGFSVSDWIQAVAQYKGGGTWQQSALTDEAHLVAKAFDNIVEEFPVPAVSAGREDVAAAALRVLIMLLEKASDYWTDDWRDEPVWLESQAEGETNKQYAVIYTGGFPDIGDPYSHAYLESAALAGLTLRVVHGHWTDNQPKVGTALPISAMEAWDGRNLGNVDDADAREVTTAATVYTVNKGLTCNITHIWHVSTAVPDVWTDLRAAGVPHNLFPAGTKATDFLLLGIECPAAHYLFSNVVFDIGTAQANLDTVWEYWDGAAPWAALTPIDNTDSAPAAAVDAFTETGVNAVWWTQQNDWVRAPLGAGGIFGAGAPAVTGYWIRCRVTNVPGAVTIPTQQNRPEYACQWPYLEVQADDIGGHIDAISKLFTECRSDDGLTGALERHVRRVTGGLRSLDRGTTFTSFLNLGNVQNPAGVSLNITGGVDSSYQSGTDYPAYYYIRYAPAVDRTLEEEFIITIDNADFYGTFRMFMRVEQVGGAAGDIGVQLRQQLFQGGSLLSISDTRYTTIVGAEHVLDFSEITIPGRLPLEVDAQADIFVYLSNSNAPTADLHCIELILIPSDEFIFTVWSEGTSVRALAVLDRRLEIDSIIDPKRLMRAHTYDTAATEIRSLWGSITGKQLSLHPNERQRYWFLYESNDVPNTNKTSYFYAGMRNQMQSSQHYLGRRGAD